MTAYIAMLRGVNVGGNPLKMEWLRAACEEIGLGDVRTYVQSGNIVFTSRLGAAKLKETLKATVDAQIRLPVTVVLRSAAEMAKIVAGNPFLKQQGVDVAKLHVTFLDKTPTKPRQNPRSSGSTRSRATATNIASWAVRSICTVRSTTAKPNFRTPPSRRSWVSAPPRAIGRP